MRQKILFEGAGQLEYEIRNIVKKAEKLQDIGQPIYWENIGDPIQKHARIPSWIKEIITGLVNDDATYGYCHSKGVLETRKFLAERTNKKGGAQITENDILFFNGLGDAISKLYQFLHSSSRIIGPSPAYATHSSAEAAHANAAPLTYRLNPENKWYPDLEHLHNQIKYNPNIIGILVINPDNPTGMVYPLETLQKMVRMARDYQLIMVSDEIYNNITYHQTRSYALAEVIEDVPGIALSGISKELPWPGARCGWMEFYNRQADKDFSDLCTALEDVKMTEVCATTLPQKSIPLIMSDSRYNDYRKRLNREIGIRGKRIANILAKLPYIHFNETYGAFFNTIVFKSGVLNSKQTLAIGNPAVDQLLSEWIQPEIALDKRFAYYLLAATGVCVVPLSSFHSDLLGFRVTLLEEDPELLVCIFEKIRDSIEEYCGSA
ncbi:MAG: aminotransferase [Cyclobacteriaceae bacterium]|nr:MAG: aminotransferase [Cyclobacteriaceae bacterium]